MNESAYLGGYTLWSIVIAPRLKQHVLKKMVVFKDELIYNCSEQRRSKRREDGVSFDRKIPFLIEKFHF